jgi:hypothetical protein
MPEIKNRLLKRAKAYGISASLIRWVVDTGRTLTKLCYILLVWNLDSALFSQKLLLSGLVSKPR